MEIISDHFMSLIYSKKFFAKRNLILLNGLFYHSKSNSYFLAKISEVSEPANYQLF